MGKGLEIQPENQTVSVYRNSCCLCKLHMLSCAESSHTCTYIFIYSSPMNRIIPFSGGRYKTRNGTEWNRIKPKVIVAQYRCGRQRCRKFDHSEILLQHSYFLENLIAERNFFLGNVIAARKFNRLCQAV